LGIHKKELSVAGREILGQCELLGMFDKSPNMTKEELREYYNSIASERDTWKKRNWYYYHDLENFHTFIVPPNHTVLELGCGTGDLLNVVKPSKGVGIDISDMMVEIAGKKYPDLEFKRRDAERLEIDEKFDYIIISNLIGSLNNIWQVFRELKKVTHPCSRVVVTYYNYLWEPSLRLAETIGLKMNEGLQNWLSLTDIENLLYLNDFEIVRKGYRFLFPKYIRLISGALNKFLANVPLIRRCCLTEFVIARPAGNFQPIPDYSCSVVIPCRNEAGNIEDAVKRIPQMGKHTEIIFVDGHSTDGTAEKIEEMMAQYPEKNCRLIHQVPRKSPNGVFSEEQRRPPNKMLRLGKGDAVRKGFEVASGDILMILDGDLTVAPEDLPKFYLAIAEGKGEFINGSRLVYAMEKKAMRLLNIFANKIFGLIFTWLLEQPVKDTLCGTKVLFKKDYLRIKEGRKFFGDFDPYGDFDLLLGAAKLNLKIVEMPVRYRQRVYGDIKIRRFKHGWLLLKMSLFAMKKLKFL